MHITPDSQGQQGMYQNGHSKKGHYYAIHPKKSSALLAWKSIVDEKIEQHGNRREPTHWYKLRWEDSSLPDSWVKKQDAFLTIPLRSSIVSGGGAKRIRNQDNMHKRPNMLFSSQSSSNKSEPEIINLDDDDDDDERDEENNGHLKIQRFSRPNNHEQVLIRVKELLGATHSPLTVISSDIPAEVLKKICFGHVSQSTRGHLVPVSPNSFNHQTASVKGCSCKDGVCKVSTCECARPFKKFAYHVADGRLREFQHGQVIQECHSGCGCSPKHCPNRVVQRGRTVTLELFYTRTHGIGIRSLQDIPAWTFIDEYLGETIIEEEAEWRGRFYDAQGMSYLFDLDGHIPTNGTATPSALTSKLKEVTELPKKKKQTGKKKTSASLTEFHPFPLICETPPEENVNQFVIDGLPHGNIARFFNHSCSPNLVARSILIDPWDSQRGIHHVAFFSNRAIKKNEQLCFDYCPSADDAYTERLLKEEVGVLRRCQCGASQCRIWVKI